MVAKCIFNSGRDLGPCVSGDFWQAGTAFDVTIGGDYVVLGMGLFESVLFVLVKNDEREPDWMPSALFRIDRQPIPEGWKFNLLHPVSASGGAPSFAWDAIFGFKELVEDGAFSTRLLEHEQLALQVFETEFARRVRMERSPREISSKDPAD